MDENSKPPMYCSKKSGLHRGIKYELLMPEALVGAAEKEKKNHGEVDKGVVAVYAKRGNVAKLSFEAFRSFVKDSRGKEAWPVNETAVREPWDKMNGGYLAYITKFYLLFFLVSQADLSYSGQFV